ncbi:MAG: hypothetical protein CMI02_17575 [Oceanospirillaceae bacterium]|nr:hypothetical protein [Oceanospirillaceae bacterium]MBT13834.1 hypothetical protein [Oceanospirillaceae bacterium]|tara:strand:- start:46732 stop:47412 length:681 start_codon:yes stop_codon:yes gene_type:complete
MIRRFALPGKNKVQHFLCTNHGELIQVHADNVIIDHKPSLLAKNPGQTTVLKLVKPRKKIEYIKMLYNHSRLTKEVKGNELMKSLGFRVPAIYESGITLMPFMLPEYLGYYVMEDLHEAGFTEVIHHLSNEATPAEERRSMLAQVRAGLKTMADHRIVFSDFHFDNVLVNDQGVMAWIDTGVTYYPAYRRNFEKKFNFTIKRLLNSGYGRHLNDAEKQEFAAMLMP